MLEKQFLIQLQFLSTTLIAAALMMGLGGWALLSKQFRNSSPGFGLVGAFGILMLGMLSLLFNFFIPLNGFFFAGLSGLSAVGLCFFLRHFPKREWLKNGAIVAVAIIAFWLLGLRRAVQSDAGLYHLPLIQWIHASALPVGLANFHTRFGTWNFWFSVCGGISAGDLLPYAVYGMNMVLAGFATPDFVRWIRNQKNPAHGYALAVFILIAFLETWTFMGGQKSPDADYAGTFLAIWVFGWFLQRKDPLENWIVPVVLLAGLAVLIKLNLAPLGVFVLFALATAIREPSKEFPAFLLGVVILGGMLMAAKSVIATGCLVFPVEKTCMPFSWRVLPAEVQDIFNAILRWARWSTGDPEMVLHTWGWVPVWWKGVQAAKIVHCVAWAVGIWALCRVLFAKRFPKLDLLSYAVAVLGIAYWFFSAPDLRFAYGYFTAIFALSLSPVIQFVLKKDEGRVRILKKVLLGCATISLVVTMVAQVLKADDWGANTLVEPTPLYQIKVNKAGQNIYVPDGEGYCWKLPLPCTPYFDLNTIQSEWGIWSVIKKGD